MPRRRCHGDISRAYHVAMQAKGPHSGKARRAHGTACPPAGRKGRTWHGRGVGVPPRPIGRPCAIQYRLEHMAHPMPHGSARKTARPATGDTLSFRSKPYVPHVSWTNCINGMRVAAVAVPVGGLGRNGPDPPNAAKPCVGGCAWPPVEPERAIYRIRPRTCQRHGTAPRAPHSIPYQYRTPYGRPGGTPLMPSISSISSRKCDSAGARRARVIPVRAAAYTHVWQRIPRRPVWDAPRDAAGSPPVGGGIIAGAGTAPSRRPGCRIRPLYTRRGPPPPPKRAGASARSGMRERARIGDPLRCRATAGARPRPGAAIYTRAARSRRPPPAARSGGRPAIPYQRGPRPKACFG